MVVKFINTICNEMIAGNFSFAILIVGILQLLEMKRNRRLKNDRSKNYS